MKPNDRERLEALLVARAVEGLDPEDAAELEARLDVHGNLDEFGYEQAAAWFWLGAGDAPVPMPRRVARRTERLLAKRAGARGPGETPPPRPPPPDHAGRWTRRRRVRVLPVPAPSLSLGPASLTLSLVLAFALASGWLNRDGDATSHRDTLAAARAELMANAPDAVRAEWRASAETGGAADIAGHVVWSDARQRGFVTVRDLPANDPSKYRYYVWVFDVGSGLSPVLGGTFSVPEDGEVIVPIANERTIVQAARFVVTREPTEAAAFSADDPPLLLAQPGASGT